MSDLNRSQALRTLLTRRLQAWPARALAVGPGQRRAAVALAIVAAGDGPALSGLPESPGWSDEAALLLTRRAAAMNRHAGQWALPGGRLDDGETAESAALREMAEEVGLVVAGDAILGRLDDYPTRSGFVITPIVVWAGEARDLSLAPAEVASAHRIPLTEWLRDDGPLLDPPHEAGGPPVLRMPLGHSWVAAPTAALIYQFREVLLLGRDTRVAHFDQPRATWG